jgi:hypothetical protein
METTQERNGDIITETCGIVSRRYCAKCGHNLPLFEFTCPNCADKEGNMTKEELVKALKEIAEGKEGQQIPYDIIVHGIQPLASHGLLLPAIYLLEHTEEAAKEA